MTYAKLSSDLITRPAEQHDAEPKRRALVLTDESAQHPFRALIPPHVRADLHDIPAETLWRLTAQDVRGFASTYIAATAAILVFIF